jgi:hypothetical protein
MFFFEEVCANSSAGSNNTGRHTVKADDNLLLIREFFDIVAQHLTGF